MPYQNSSHNFLLIWEYSSHYKSIASYDKTKIPLNLRRKTVSQILSRGVSILQFFMNSFSTLHQVSSLHQVSAKFTHAYDAGALNRFWHKVTWFKIFHFSFFSLLHWCKALRQKGRRWHILKKYRLMARFKSHQGVRFHKKRGRHRRPRGPRWRPRSSVFRRNGHLGAIKTEPWA